MTNPGPNFFMFVAFSAKMLSNCRTSLPMGLALPLRNPEFSNYLDIASVNSLMPKCSLSVFDEFYRDLMLFNRVYYNCVMESTTTNMLSYKIL